MKVKVLFIFLLFFACSRPFSYQRIIEEYGQPKNEFWERKVPQPETLYCQSQEVLVYFPVSVSWFWISPELKAGELCVRNIEFCSVDNSYCLEFDIDGLSFHSNRDYFSLHKIDLLRLRRNKQEVLFSSFVPVKGQTRAVHVTAFVPRKFVKKKDTLIVSVRDGLNNKHFEVIVKGGEKR